MRLSNEVFVRPCDPDRDLDSVAHNIMATGYYVDGQDDADSMRRFLTRTPDCVIVAEDRENQIIAGNLYVPDSQIPLLARLAINPVFEDNPGDSQECKRLLLNNGFDTIRRRNPRMPHAEILYDWYPSRPEPPPPLDEDYKKFGFQFGFDLYSVTYDLWDAEGNPTYIPPFPNS